MYPLPTQVTYTREIDFDDAGGIWTSNSNAPAWQIETGVPRIVRLDPLGSAGANDEAGAAVCRCQWSMKNVAVAFAAISFLCGDVHEEPAPSAGASERLLGVPGVKRSSNQLEHTKDNARAAGRR